MDDFYIIFSKEFVIEDYLVFLIYILILLIITMANINKKQITLGVLAVVLATAMIASILVDNSVDARRHHKSNHQSISQSCHQDQKSTVVTAGANSPVSNSGNNAARCTNTNNGGNAAVF
jgi:membrane-anchored protein YejM (alkaline phosphatase superfamily)